MTTTVIAQMIAWLTANERKLHYTENEPARTSMPQSGATDCSGLNKYVFQQFAGINIGTYTGNECDYGVDLKLTREQIRAGEGLLPGDVLFWLWEHRDLGSDPWDHTSFVKDSGHVFNHGGPNYDDMGPVVQTIASNVDNCVAVMARRFIPQSGDSTDTSTESPIVQEDDMPQIAFVKIDPASAGADREDKRVFTWDGSSLHQVITGGDLATLLKAFGKTRVDGLISHAQYVALAAK